MHLCFGSFSIILLKNKKNNAVTKAIIGRALLELIKPDYITGKEDSYIYVFMDQKRELPKELMFQMTDMIKVGQQFAQFIDKYINPDHERLLRGLSRLIKEDADLPKHIEDRLLQQAIELALSEFLAELFVFVVDNTRNKTDAKKSRASRKRSHLLEEIDETFDNDILVNLARRAIQEQDMRAFNTCLGKLVTNINVARELISLFPNNTFANRDKYKEAFYSYINCIENKDTEYYQKDAWTYDVTTLLKK